MKTIDEELNEILEKADTIIESEVVRLAMRVLKANSKVHEFIIAMGTFFFTRRGNKNVHFTFSTQEEICSLKNGKELFDFIHKWDNQFKVTGNSLRFSLKSEIKRDW